jgi:hypothetical protein
MAPMRRIEALQGALVFCEDDWVRQPCNCFHGTIPGQMDHGFVLTCGEAPWRCPKRTYGPASEPAENPPLSNRGVSSIDVDPVSPGFEEPVPGE